MSIYFGNQLVGVATPNTVEPINLTTVGMHTFTGDITYDGTRLFPYQFYRDTGITSFNAPNVIRFTDAANANTNGVGSNVFRYCSNLTEVNFPNCIGVGSGGYQFANCTKLQHVHLPKTFVGANMFNGCTGLITAVFPHLNGASTMNGSGFTGCTKLESVDIKTTKIGNTEFSGCTKLTTLVLRYSTAITALNNVSAFNNTPFKSGGTGGEIYIPQVLYDHLGDGTALDYQAATNWSTIHGYGTITWKKIEGSAYANTYVDGTTIS